MMTPADNFGALFALIGCNANRDGIDRPATRSLARRDVEQSRARTVNNGECVQFLQWALPRLDMRWPGFRKVRRQVCRRIARRLCELELSNTLAYRDYLERNPDEWQVLDSACRITISRFCRDRGVFEGLATKVLPALARTVVARGGRELACLSVGSASGEEAYSLKILWELGSNEAWQTLGLHITGIDSHPVMLERARRGCFHLGSLKDLPESWRARAFERVDGEWRLRAEFRQGIEFVRGDVRHLLPTGPFDLVLCRNLVFTYFVDSLQRNILGRLHAHMHEGAALVVGIHESLPENCVGFQPWDAARCTYRRVSAT